MCCYCWPKICCVDQAGLELTVIPYLCLLSARIKSLSHHSWLCFRILLFILSQYHIGIQSILVIPTSNTQLSLLSDTSTHLSPKLCPLPFLVIQWVQSVLPASDKFMSGYAMSRVLPFISRLLRSYFIPTVSHMMFLEPCGGGGVVDIDASRRAQHSTVTYSQHLNHSVVCIDWWSTWHVTNDTCGVLYLAILNICTIILQAALT